MPITATSRDAGSGVNLRQKVKPASSTLPLASAIQSLDWPMRAIRLMATNAAAAKALEENTAPPAAFIETPVLLVLAHLEQEVAAGLVAGVDRRTVLRLLREVVL